MSDAPATPPVDDPRWQRLLARGGAITVAFATPDGWPHGPLPAGQKTLDVGEDRLTASYCTLQGHRFLRAVLYLPIKGARTVFGYETWASVSPESYAAFLDARAGGEAFPGCFAWAANALPGFDLDAPLACNLLPGAPGKPAQLQPQGDSALAKAQASGISPDKLADIYAAAGQDISALLDG
ncbi:MAG TPA: DUF2199 domain-containing protein [Rhodobacterales bacterium]|nr:DUF2199 domain-containing protein [Rhodobacterales bacterium]